MRTAKSPDLFGVWLSGSLGSPHVTHPAFWSSDRVRDRAKATSLHCGTLWLQ